MTTFVDEKICLYKMNQGDIITQETAKRWYNESPYPKMRLGHDHETSVYGRCHILVNREGEESERCMIVITKSNNDTDNTKRANAQWSATSYATNLGIYEKTAMKHRRYFPRPFRMEQHCTIEDFNNDREDSVDSLRRDFAKQRIDKCTKEMYTVKGYACLKDDEYLYKLDEYIKGRLSKDKSVLWQMDLADEIGRALFACHSAGYTHNDLHPVNIGVCEPMDNPLKVDPSIVILNFGDALPHPAYDSVDDMLRSMNFEVDNLNDVEMEHLEELWPFFYKEIKLGYLKEAQDAIFERMYYLEQYYDKQMQKMRELQPLFYGATQQYEKKVYTQQIENIKQTSAEIEETKTTLKFGLNKVIKQINHPDLYELMAERKEVQKLY